MPHSPEHLHQGSESARGERTGQRPDAPEYTGDSERESHVGTYLGHDEHNIYLSPLSGTGADSTDARVLPRKDLDGRDITGFKRDFDPTNLIGRTVKLDRERSQPRAGGDWQMQNKMLSVVNKDGTPDMDWYGNSNKRIGRGPGAQRQGSLMSDPAPRQVKPKTDDESL